MTNPASKPPTFNNPASDVDESPAREACRSLWDMYGTPVRGNHGSRRFVREADILVALAEVLTECRDGAGIFDAARDWLEVGLMHIPEGQA